MNLLELTEKIYFSVSKEFKKDVTKIAEEKTKDRTFSAFITQAILEKYQRERQTKIADFVEKEQEERPELELDFLPKVNEVITRHHLKQLNDVDLGRLYKMMHYNLSFVKKFIDSPSSGRRQEQEDFFGR